MNITLEQQAKMLAARAYTTQIDHEELPDGEYVFVVKNAELPGCMAQGTTLAEAMLDLMEVRKLYILSLLEDKVPIPNPSITIDTTGGDSFLFGIIDLSKGEPINPIVEETSAKENDYEAARYEYRSETETLVQMSQPSYH